MEEEAKKELASIRKLAAAQTVIQAGAVAELEAHRRELAAQTELMRDASAKAFADSTTTWLERNALDRFLDGIAEAEVAAMANDPQAELIAILAHKAQFLRPPSSAGLPERIRAKELLRRREHLLKELIQALPKWLAAADDWWLANGIANRVIEIEGLCATIVDETAKAVKVHSDLMAKHGKDAVREGRRVISELQSVSDTLNAKAGALEKELLQLPQEQRLILADQRKEIAPFLDGSNQADRDSFAKSIAEMRGSFETHLTSRNSKIRFGHLLLMATVLLSALIWGGPDYFWWATIVLVLVHGFWWATSSRD